MFFSNIKKNDILVFLKRFFPILVWLPQYNLKKLRGDVVAGLTCGVVVIPQSIAFAYLAKLPPQHGLYASLTPGLIYSIFGTSKDLSAGTTVTLGLYTSRFNPTESPLGASLLSFLTGVILVLMGIFKLGFLIKYVPQLVISAFVSAAAVTIIVTQFSSFLGIKNPYQNVFQTIKHIIVNIKHTNTWDLTMSVCCLVFLTFFVLLSKRKKNPNPKIHIKARAFMEAMLWFLCASRMALVCLFATITVFIFHINGFKNKFSMAGSIQKGLPTFQNIFEPLKNDTLKTTNKLIEGFGASLFVLPIIMFIEQMSIAKAFARKFNYKVKAQQELIAIGMCNIFGSFYGGWPVGGGFTRSAVNSMSGAQTPLAGAISGIVVLIALEFMTPAFYYIPSAGLAAMMLMAVLTMVQVNVIKKIWKLHKWDLLPFLTAFCTSFYKLEYGVMAGMGIAILMMLSREARPKYYLSRDDKVKSVTILLMENLTYPGVDAVNKTIFSEVNSFSCIETLYLDMSTMVRVDFTILQNFEFLREELSKKKVQLRFVNFSRESVKIKLLNAGLIVDDDVSANNFACSMLTKSEPMSRNGTALIGDIAKIKYLKTGLIEEDIVLGSSDSMEEKCDYKEEKCDSMEEKCDSMEEKCDSMEENSVKEDCLDFKF